MNEPLTWTSSLTMMEWLTLLLLLLLLGILGYPLVKQSVVAFRARRARPETRETRPIDWHCFDLDRVFLELRTGPDGLSAQEAEQRRARHGPNRLPEVKPRGPVARFLSQFHNVLIYVLLVAGATTMALGHWLDAGVILGVVLINAVIGFIQEGKAEDALRAIRQMLSPQAMVSREGRYANIPAEELVPGDVVLLQSGDKVPADLRLFRVNRLQIQEAVLTGESLAVEKKLDSSAPETPLGDRRGMAYSGTLVSYGQGAGVVVATGAQTEIGRIGALVAEVEQLTTPLLRQMAEFGRWLTLAIFLVAAATFAFGVLVRGYTAVEMFLAAVGLAVAAIPEGLPAIMTITLAIGVQRMARRNAIIRSLPAVETLGAVSVICSDKTGTLTCNEMTVRSIATDSGISRFSGTGYDPHGGILTAEQTQLPNQRELILAATRAALLCNDANLENCGDVWRVHGDPMEGALLVAAQKAGLDWQSERKELPRTDIIPFESEYQFMATLHHSHTGEAFIFVKGAPEKLLTMCRLQQGADGDRPLDRARWERQLDLLATQGQRILAVAMKPALPHQQDLDFADVESGLVLLGLFGLIDPPREESISAVARCQAAGIRVKMITGDHAVTARAIARQLRLAGPEDVLTGHDLERMTDDELARRVAVVDVYARVAPEHKLRLIESLQAQGMILAMTGDGVNDAPALKRADVGIAMGKNGTEAAKEASNMVLVDDNFASISHAVEEGRTVYDNIKKAILFILPTNGGEALVLIAAIAFGFHQLPITPAQILWINMITAVTLALALAFEPPEHNVMQRAPRNPREPVLSILFIWRIVFVSVILMSGTFGLFLWEMERGASIEEARTIAVNTLVMFEIFYLFNSRYITEPVLNTTGLTGNRYVLIAITLLVIFQLGFTYLEVMQQLFGTTGIAPAIWARILIVSSSVLFLVELEKAIVRRLRRRRAVIAARRSSV